MLCNSDVSLKSLSLGRLPLCSFCHPLVTYWLKPPSCLSCKISQSLDFADSISVVILNVFLHPCRGVVRGVITFKFEVFLARILHRWCVLPSGSDLSLIVFLF